MKPFDYYSTPVDAVYPDRADFRTTFWYSQGECVAKQVGQTAIEYFKAPRPLDGLTKEVVNNDDAYTAARRTYGEAAGKIVEEFRQDLFAELGIADNPRREKLYSLAYERGHAHGFEEVFSQAQSLVELIT